MIDIFKLKGRAVRILVIIASAAVQGFAQNLPSPIAEASFLESNGLYVGILAIAAVGVAAVIFLRKRGSADKIVPANKIFNKVDSTQTGQSVNKNVMTKAFGPNSSPATESGEARTAKYTEAKKEEFIPVRRPELSKPFKPDLNTGLGRLPIGSFNRLELTPSFTPLPNSHDAELLRAIDQTLEGSEEDVEVRSAALKTLSGFRTGNSIAAISQIAMYDLSAKLRANSVLVLAEFDHESVFEHIVTACADPTREVRAAAARSYVRLSFDRAHAWARIVETKDESFMRQIARVAVEGDLVERSFDRLVHTDKNIAYEAFALTALMISSGETDLIYKTLSENKEEKVKLALLHVLQTIKNETTFQSLSDLLNRNELTPKVVTKANEVRSYAQLINV